MTKTKQQLALELIRLEAQLSAACQKRSENIKAAEAAIKAANREFDRVALSLGRKINKLREQVTPIEPKAPTTTNSNGKGHDPEWSQEDIDHYYELVHRGR